MASIKLIDAAKHYKELPHQIAAWNALQGLLTPDQLSEFAEVYRAAPRPKETPLANTWDDVSTLARRAGAKYPELVAAQWALESGWGKHFSGTWNAFGLKGPGTDAETKEFINGKWVTITAGFINFPDLATCVQYLVDRWYKDFKNFHGVNHAWTRNAAAKRLVSEGYATDPTYAEKLIRLMDEHGSPAVQTPKFTPSTPFSYKLTPNITYGELALHSEVRRFKAQYQCDTAVVLAQFVQKARDHFGKPAIITSGYRPPKINAQVGGATRSEHLYDVPDTGAIDFYLDGMSVLELQRWLDKHYPFSLGYGAPKGFVHIGIRPGRPRVRWDY